MPCTLPDHVDVSAETLQTIADRHGVGGSDVERLPETGIFNAIYRLGDGAILRIPRNHPKFIEAAHNEAIAVPAARAAGVRTPRLLAFDDSLEVLRCFLEPPGRSLARAWRGEGRSACRSMTR